MKLVEKTTRIGFDHSTGLDIVQLGLEDSFKFSGLTAAIYAHEELLNTPDEYAKVYDDDTRLGPFSIFVTVCPPGTLSPIAGMRVAIKTPANYFLIEEKLHIDIQKVLADSGLTPKIIWHCGRIGIHKPSLKKYPSSGKLSHGIVKTLIRELFAICLTDESNVLLGENMKQTDRLYRLLGFPMRKIAEANFNSKVTLIGSILTGKEAAEQRANSKWL